MLNKLLESVKTSDVLGAATPWIMALVIIVVGYFIARIIRTLVTKALQKTTLDEKLSSVFGDDSEGSEKGIASFVFWLLMLFIVVIALNTAGLDKAIQPLNEILTQIMGFIPKLLAAVAIGFVAWILATVAKNILTGILNASKVDSRLGLGESKPITNSLGMITFFGIILVFVPMALDALQMDVIAKPIGEMISQIFAYVPKIFGGIAIFAIGYLIASIVQKVVTNVLESIGADRLPTKLGYKSETLVAGKSLSELIGIVLMATILVIISAQAITIMDLGFISDLAQGIVPGYINILAAVIILCVAFFVANLVGQMIESPFWAKVVRMGIIVFLGAVALQKANISDLTNETFQLAITATIVAAAFAAGVGGAIALGLGGREKAKKVLDNLKK